jgi:hypothetical protein
MTTQEKVWDRLCTLVEEVSSKEFGLTLELEPFSERNEPNEELAIRAVEFIEQATHQILANRKLAREKGVL